MNVANVCIMAKKSSLKLASASAETKNAMLNIMAESLIKNTNSILDANKIDLENCHDKGKAFLDRLALTPERIEQMKNGMLQVIDLPDPIGEKVDAWKTPTGLNISKVRAPLGVIAIIYEARPNVTADCAALTIKSSNAVILRGSKDAINSNRAIYLAMKNALVNADYDSEVIQFIDDETRESSNELLKQSKYVDVVIPRGGEKLKKFILENATMPVIASSGGNCHIYVESTANIEMATNIIINAKTQRPSVCNACETVLVDNAIADKFLKYCIPKLQALNVEIRGCEKTASIVPNITKATLNDYATEFLDYILAVKVVENIDEAINHINTYSTHHSETIITKDSKCAEMFTKSIDSAVVYVNTSTRFTDGFEFGFGAEMGISTQKLHARGPLGLKELTSIKYSISSNGVIRK